MPDLRDNPLPIRLLALAVLAAGLVLVAHQAGYFAPSPPVHAPGRPSAPRTVSPETAQGLLQGPDAPGALDLRPTEKYRLARVPGAASMSYASPYFATWLKELDKNRIWLIYGPGPKQVRLAAEHMLKTGFREILIIEGGMKAWMDLKLPVETGAAPPTAPGGDQPG